MIAPPPSARLVVDTGALVANWRAFAAASGGAECGAALKADGYGLGAAGVLAALAPAGLREVFVAQWAEVAALGPLPDGVRVAVLHGVAAAEMPAALASPARPVLVTAAQVAAWRPTGRACDVMVDTGMNRLGLTPDEAVSGLLDGLALDTLHSHLACAELPGHPLNAAQGAAFAQLAARVPARRHALANSGGICLGRDYLFDLTRPGIGLYGGGAGPGGAPLAPVAQLSALILQVRDVPAGASVGYGATFVTRRPTRLAVAALGYADGYPRGASGAWQGRIGGVACPQIGRVAMDLTCFDVTDAPPCAEGDAIDIDFNLAVLAAASGRSEYELLTGLGARYARVYR
jgi:alanine racemase